MSYCDGYNLDGQICERTKVGTDKSRNANAFCVHIMSVQIMSNKVYFLCGRKFERINCNLSVQTEIWSYKYNRLKLELFWASCRENRYDADVHILPQTPHPYVCKYPLLADPFPPRLRTSFMYAPAPAHANIPKLVIK